jgi:hypothetical protein
LDNAGGKSVDPSYLDHLLGRERDAARETNRTDRLLRIESHLERLKQEAGF